jgi:superfamily I DNA and RNA helicase
MKLIPSLPSYQDDEAAKATWKKIDSSVLKEVDGVAYYKHPIIISASDEAPDLVFLGRGYEPTVIKVVGGSMTSIDSATSELWAVDGVVLGSPLMELDDYLVGLQSRFDRQRGLRARLNPVGILSLPLITRSDFWSRFNESELLSAVSDPEKMSFLFRDDAVNAILAKNAFLAGDDNWRLSMSVFQGVNPLNKPAPAAPLDTSNMGDAIRSLNYQIALLDDEQHQVATQLAPGPQRIRGLAGTGKTVILAMKAANIHLHFPEKKILFTFNTQSLYQQIEKLISAFYRVNGDTSPNWEVLHVRHGWGGARRPGVYSDACKRLGLNPLGFIEAKRRNSESPFAECCADLLKATILPEYDFVLVDEAQDFPKEFFKVLAKIAKEPLQICFAYDEMQSLSNVDIPSAVDQFGLRDDGSPVVDISGDAYPGGIERDFVLHRSYRCPLEVLLTAHAIGLGIYSESGCVQMLSNQGSWESIGYTVEEGSFQLGDRMKLRRSPENSPNKIAHLYGGDQAFVQSHAFADKNAEIQAIAARIAYEVTNEGVRPEDIVVICLDNRQAKSQFQALQSALFKYELRSTIPGLVNDAWEFTLPGCITLSTIYRAKGNEAPIIHIMSFEALYGFAEEVENRNRAFTAISRAKGWLRIYGTGPTMREAENELNKVKANLPFLSFVFPDMEAIERKLDSAETTRRRRVVSKVKKGVVDILDADEAALNDLDPEMLRKLKERLNLR